MGRVTVCLEVGNPCGFPSSSFCFCFHPHLVPTTSNDNSCIQKIPNRARSSSGGPTRRCSKPVQRKILAIAAATAEGAGPPTESKKKRAKKDNQGAAAAAAAAGGTTSNRATALSERRTEHRRNRCPAGKGGQGRRSNGTYERVVERGCDGSGRARARREWRKRNTVNTPVCGSRSIATDLPGGRRLRRQQHPRGPGRCGGGEQGAVFESNLSLEQFGTSPQHTSYHRRGRNTVPHSSSERGGSKQQLIPSTGRSSGASTRSGL